MPSHFLHLTSKMTDPLIVVGNFREKWTWPTKWIWLTTIKPPSDEIFSQENIDLDLGIPKTPTADWCWRRPVRRRWVLSRRCSEYSRGPVVLLVEIERRSAAVMIVSEQHFLIYFHMTFRISTCNCKIVFPNNTISTVALPLIPEMPLILHQCGNHCSFKAVRILQLSNAE